MDSQFNKKCFIIEQGFSHFGPGTPSGLQEGVKGSTERFNEKYCKNIKINTTTATTKYHQIILKINKYIIITIVRLFRYTLNSGQKKKVTNQTTKGYNRLQNIYSFLPIWGFMKSKLLQMSALKTDNLNL